MIVENSHLLDKLKGVFQSASLDPVPYLERIKIAQKAFEEFAGKDCRIKFSHALGTSIEAIIFGSCLVDKYHHRADELNQYVALFPSHR